MMKISLVLAGGFGTRLWPLSRMEYPKQFAKVISDESTYQQSLRRSELLADKTLVVTSDIYKFQALGQAREIGLPLDEEDIVLEPERKDTAPAIYYGLKYAVERWGLDDALIMVFPSDHMIMNESEFFRAMKVSLDAASRGYISLVSVPPSKPEPGFGYVKIGEPLREGVYKVERFVEKPSKTMAEEMMREGGWFWSTMIMTFKLSTFLDIIERVLPGVVEPFKRYSDVKEAYRNVQKIDISSGMLSKIPSNLAIVPTENLGWSDLGSFEAIYELLDKDNMGNALSGRVKMSNSEGNLILSKRLVALVDVRDMIIVDDEDAILVMPRGHGQNLKGLIESMLKEKLPEALRHRVVYEQWGLTESLLRGDGYEVRRIKVHPGKGFGPRRHYHKSIYWGILSGTATIRVNGDEKVLTKGDGVQIPVGTIYELVNPGRIPLEIIEIATGEYLGEDDLDESGF